MMRDLWEVIKESSELYSEHEGVQEIIHNDKQYMLHGRADLIYKTKDNKYGVIDFKTGNPPSWINIVSGSAPQISIEILMLKFGGFIDVENIELTDCGFISPKGFLKVTPGDSIIQSSIDGIKLLIDTFWENQSPYYQNLKDLNSPYRMISRTYQ